MFLLSENDGLKWVDFAGALSYRFTGVENDLLS
jgi:hypothetical protein